MKTVEHTRYEQDMNKIFGNIANLNRKIDHGIRSVANSLSQVKHMKKAYMDNRKGRILSKQKYLGKIVSFDKRLKRYDKLFGQLQVYNYAKSGRKYYIILNLNQRNKLFNWLKHDFRKSA